MIRIESRETRHPVIEHKECTGCGVCACACPEGNIVLEPDREGFFYPTINTTQCSGCGECERVCPVMVQARLLSTEEVPKESIPKVFAAWHVDTKIRKVSSSGGVFTALATHVIDNLRGGVVGAALGNCLTVRHTLIERVEELPRLRGAKYVQSFVDPDVLSKLIDFVRAGRPILFSGTPCQVAGVKRLIQEQLEHLFLVDLVCHGVPSPRLFKKHLELLSKKGRVPTEVFFRDKKDGWKQYRVKVKYSDGSHKSWRFWQDPYMLAFLRNYSLRPACYRCKFANLLRPGDITLGDFWGVGKKYPHYDNEDLGTSLVLVNTKRGQSLLEACKEQLYVGEADMQWALKGNPSLVRPVDEPGERQTFYVDLDRMPLWRLYQKYNLSPPSRLTKAFRAVGRIKEKVVQTFQDLPSWGRR